MHIRSDSCHPRSVKRSLAYGLGIRIRRICEKECDYQTQRKILKAQLRKRGYSGKLIESQLQRVDRLDRDELLQYKKKKASTDRVPLVLTFSKCLPDVGAILTRHQNTLFRSPRLRDIFGKPSLVSYRRGKNLCDTLVHAKTHRVVRTNRVICDCSICDLIVRHPIMDTRRQQTCAVIKEVNCATNNIVYALLCNKCQTTIYVGETSRSIKERLSEHRRDVRAQNGKPICRHFDYLHDCEDVRISVLKTMPDRSLQHRLICEKHYINKLQTMTPSGCNIKIN